MAGSSTHPRILHLLPIRQVRVRRLGGDRAGEIRFTRFLHNPAVTLDEMIATAFARTQDACKGREVLAIQDTTVTQSSGGGGSFLHAMIAVGAQSGAVLDALENARRAAKRAARSEAFRTARACAGWRRHKRPGRSRARRG